MKLSQISKTEFDKLVKEKFNEQFKKAKLTPEEINKMVDTIFNNKYEQIFDIDTVLKGIEQQLDSKLFKEERIENAKKGKIVEGIVLGTIDKVTTSSTRINKTKVFILEPKQSFVYEYFGGHVGNEAKEKIKLEMLDEVKFFWSPFVMKDKNGKVSGELPNIDLLISKTESEDFSKILNNAIDLENIVDKMFKQYDALLVHGKVKSFRPISVLKEIDDKWRRIDWKPFFNNGFNFELVLENGKNTMNISFQAPTLSDQSIVILDNKARELTEVAKNITLSQKDEELFDPSKSFIGNPICMTNQKVNAEVCISNCEACIYSLLSRLKGKDVMVAVSYGKADSSSNGTFFNKTVGYSVIFLGDKELEILNKLPKKVQKDGKAIEPKKIDKKDEKPVQPKSVDLFAEVKKIVESTDIKDAESILKVLPKGVTKEQVDLTLKKVLEDIEKSNTVAGKEEIISDEEIEEALDTTDVKVEELDEIVKFIGENKDPKGITHAAVIEKFGKEVAPKLKILHDKGEIYQPVKNRWRVP